MPDMKLSTLELEERSKEMATNIEDLIAIEEEKKSVVADFNDRIKERKKEIARLARVVRTGVEFRSDQLSMFPRSSGAVN